MAEPKLAKAVMMPMNGDQPDGDENTHIRVQFNPASLRVALANSLKADNSGGATATAAQYVEKSESTLTLQLIFDSSVAREGHAANTDVRLQTKKIAATFMQPQNPDSERPAAPLRCRFQWGAFAFVGMLSSYNETLDFFSPEGLPLRATLALTLKEDRYQFETRDTKDVTRELPSFAQGGESVSAADAAATAGKNSKQWRDVALFNGMENPRLSASAGIAIPGVGLQANIGLGPQAKAGFSLGASSSLGTDIPGAFASLNAQPLVTAGDLFAQGHGFVKKP